MSEWVCIGYEVIGHVVRLEDGQVMARDAMRGQFDNLADLQRRLPTEAEQCLQALNTPAPQESNAHVS